MASTSFSFSNQINRRTLPAISPPPYPPQFRISLRVRASYATAERASAGGIANYAQYTASFYEVLGIRTGATCQEIKSAYRKLARVLHPDAACSGGSPSADEFMRVHAAYATLSDPEKRAVYDSSLFRRQCAAAVVSLDGGYSDVTRRKRTWETDQCW